LALHLFGAGVYMGRYGKNNPYKKGARMVLFRRTCLLIVGFLLDGYSRVKGRVAEESFAFATLTSSLPLN
jgi:hypothetical protein